MPDLQQNPAVSSSNPPVNTNPQVGTQPPVLPRRANFKLFIVLLMIVVVVLGVIGYYFFSIRKKDTSTGKAPATPEKVMSDSSHVFPVDPAKPGVDWLGVLYRFNGHVSRVENTPAGTIISLVENDGFPEFIVIPEAQVFFLSPKSKTLAKVEDVKPGQEVKIYMSFDPGKRWRLQQVNIIRP